MKTQFSILGFETISANTKIYLKNAKTVKNCKKQVTSVTYAPFNQVPYPFVKII